MTTEASTSPTADLTDWGRGRSAIDRAMADAVDRHGPALGPSAPAVRYALEGGGKRVRGLLCLAAFQACGATGDATAVAAALEIVHAYSLVHDDLPCMDDDALRRGRATVHVAFSVDSATIAGVAMVPLAARAMLDACASLGLPETVQREMVRRLMSASGAAGMVGGQLLDLYGEGRNLSLSDLETIHRGKTGALIAAAASLGGLAAQTSMKRVDALGRYGAALGLAFQVMDDVLDVTSTTATLGKTAGRDIALGKSTYPGLIGLTAARYLAEQKVEEARSELRQEGLLTADLDRFAAFVVERAS